MKTLEAYIDGSVSKEEALYSYGAILLDDGEIVDELSGVDDEYIESNQIAGELFGCLYAVQWAINNGYGKIHVYYDYIGIEKFASGEWNPGKKVSLAYVYVFRELEKHIDIEFTKVKAHTGVKYNEMADDLAKSALGIKT